MNNYPIEIVMYPRKGTFIAGQIVPIKVYDDVVAWGEVINSKGDRLEVRVLSWEEAKKRGCGK